MSPAVYKYFQPTEYFLSIFGLLVILNLQFVKLKTKIIRAPAFLPSAGRFVAGKIQYSICGIKFAAKM
ncbi:MAG: hypothetical protein DWQ02_03335 [Bacteroidetes bacterium]|nr:MAG: hypothetical protein DWQ02_03335 [Bacteroidota bacterium]